MVRVLLGALVWFWALIIGLTCLCSVLSWMDTGLPAPVLWLFSLTGHFRVQYLVVQFAGLLGLLIALFCSRSGKKIRLIQLLVLLPFLLINLYTVLPYYQANAINTAPTGSGLRLFLVNIGPIHDFQPLLGLIQNTEPTIVCVTEQDQDLDRILSGPVWQKSFPYRAMALNEGLGIYSRIPLTGVNVDAPSMQVGPSLITEIEWRHQPVTMILAHPSVPVSPEAWQRQRNHFAHWIEGRKRYRPNLIILGDFNSTPWMPHFQRLLKGTGLRDSSLGFGVQPSWFVNEPWAAVPIDQVLVSPKIQVFRRFIGPEVGSDHRPVIVDLDLETGKL